MTDELFERNRIKVLDAFCPETGAYSHVTPYKQNHFIDGMAWVSLLAGAAHRYGDGQILDKCVQYLNTLTALGSIHYNDPLALRSYGPAAISDRWKHHGKHYSLRKQQAFAGPAAYCWAVKQGCMLVNKPGHNIKEPAMAKLFTNGLVVNTFGLLAKFFPALEQHINSVMLAHLLDDKKPKALKYHAKNNPFYSIIMKDDFYTPQFPPPRDMEGGRTVNNEAPTTFAARQPGPWPGKNHVTSLYYYPKPGVPVGDEYTPACWLFCYYMHHAGGS